MVNHREMSVEPEPDPGSETTPVARSRTAALTARLRNRRLAVHAAWVVVIFAIALTARSLWVAYAPADPGDGRHLNDTQLYFGSAVELAHGKGYVNPFTGTPTAYWPPGYSFLLAGLFRLFGTHVEVAWTANIVLGALTCVALYVVGYLIAGQRVGALAGLLLAVLPGHVFFSSVVLSEILFTFLAVLVIALILLVPRAKGDRMLLRLAAVGALIGVATLVRGQGLILLPTAALFWWLSTADLLRALRWTAIVTLVCVGVIVPWTVRNYFAMDSFVFISTNAGGNLYMGNHDGASGGFQLLAASWIADEYAHLSPERQEVKISNRALREGLDFMIHHPGKELQLAGSKLRYLYQDDEESLLWIDAPEVGKPLESRPVWADITNDFYFTVLVLSAGGLVYWLRRPRSAVALPLVMVLLFTAGQLLFFTVTRFHFPMLPSFCLLAAVGVVKGVEGLWSWAAARRTT
jgi:4-amino-4-deoxy-L-arabinose transferase-like glycosyltransferase